MIIWKFDQCLQEYDLTPAQVERKIIRLGYEFGAKTIYRFTGAGPTNINKGSLEAILTALTSLTKIPVTINDLIEFEYQPEIDVESKAWLEADLAPPIDEYNWGDIAPSTLGKPIKYTQGVIDVQINSFPKVGKIMP